MVADPSSFSGLCLNLQGYNIFLQKRIAVKLLYINFTKNVKYIEKLKLYSLSSAQTVTLYGVIWYNVRWNELETVGVISFG